jgi:hypothetical protein
MTDFNSPSLAEETELLAQNRPPVKRVITLSHEYLVHEEADQARAFAERDAAIELYLKQGYKLATTFFVPVAIKARIVDTLTK